MWQKDPVQNHELCLVVMLVSSSSEEVLCLSLTFTTLTLFRIIRHFVKCPLIWCLIFLHGDIQVSYAGRNITVFSLPPVRCCIVWICPITSEVGFDHLIKVFDFSIKVTLTPFGTLKLCISLHLKYTCYLNPGFIFYSIGCNYYFYFDAQIIHDMSFWHFTIILWALAWFLIEDVIGPSYTIPAPALDSSIYFSKKSNGESYL